MNRFRDLQIGDTFDFLNDAQPMMNSFYLRVRKISARKYETLDGKQQYRIGSVYATVYHVEHSSARWPMGYYACSTP